MTIMAIALCISMVADLKLLQARVPEPPSLDALYSESVISPGVAELKTFLDDIFRSGCNKYRFMSLNFLGPDPKRWASEQFLWYYLETMKGEKAVDSQKRSNWNSVTRALVGRFDETSRLPHLHLTIDNHHIYFVLNRPTHLEIEVVFSCDASLYTDDRPWHSLISSLEIPP